MSDAFGMEIDASEVTAGIVGMISKANPVTGRAAKKTGIWLLNAAVNDAPVETGLLRSSGSIFVNGAPFLQAPNISQEETPRHPSSEQGPKSKNETVVTVGFNTHYAAEMDTRRDIIHPKGGRAGYLTDNFAKATVVYEKFLKAESKGLK
jgi:hypothetical protein